MTAKKKARVFIDGASRGNPGPAAVGIVFEGADGAPAKEMGLKIGHATNNVAEYYALIFALQEALMMGVEELGVYTDSELLARQFSGQYKIKDKDLQLLGFQVRHLVKGFKSVSVSHVPREKNRLADLQANKALDGNELFLQAG